MKYLNSKVINYCNDLSPNISSKFNTIFNDDLQLNNFNDLNNQKADDYIESESLKKTKYTEENNKNRHLNNKFKAEDRKSKNIKINTDIMRSNYNSSLNNNNFYFKSSNFNYIKNKELNQPLVGQLTKSDCQLSNNLNTINCKEENNKLDKFNFNNSSNSNPNLLSFFRSNTLKLSRRAEELFSRENINQTTIPQLTGNFNNSNDVKGLTDTEKNNCCK